MSKQLTQLFKLKRRLEFQARRIGLTLTVNVLNYSPAETTLEDGKTYHYPECIEVNFENWSTGKYSFRMQDGRFIREGTLLSGQGLTAPQIYKRQLRELRRWHKAVEKGA